MARKNVNTRELAQVVGYGPRTISQWRHGQQRCIPRPFLLVQIADHLDVSVDWLLGRE